MLESVFRKLLEQSLVSAVEVLPVVAAKGKPARRSRGRELVWSVRIHPLSGRGVEFIEAARGGPREWASLDRLIRWLSTCGVEVCSVRIQALNADARQGELALIA